MAVLRLFVAAPISESIEEGLDGILAKVSNHRSIKWALKAQLHLTLRFIGTLEESRLPKLEGIIKDVSFQASPFEAEIGGLDAFPRLDRPRVLFIPVLRGEKGFKGLERALTPALEKWGIKADEKDYQPHLTLGRAREKEDPKAAVRALQEVCPAHWEPWKVEKLILFKSQLTPEGPVYTRLREFEFGKD